MKFLAGLVVGILAALLFGAAWSFLTQGAERVEPVATASDAPALTIAVSEAFLQQQAAAVSTQTGIANVAVDLEPTDRLAVSGDVQTPLAVRPTLTYQLGVADNAITLTALGAEVNNLELPGALATPYSMALAQQIEAEVNRWLRPVLEQGGLRLVKVRIEANTLVVEAGQ